MAIKSRTFNLFSKITQSQKRVVSTSSTSLQVFAAKVAPVPCPFQEKQSTSDKLPEQYKDQQSVATPVKAFDSIPGPKGLPIVGTLFDYMKKDGPIFNKIFEVFRERSLQYGPIFKEKLVDFTTVVISDPAEYNKVIRAEGKYPLRRDLEPWFLYREKRKMGQGLVNSHGPEWHKYRSAAAKKMLNMKEVSEYCTNMDEVADEFVAHISRLMNPQGEVVGIEKEFFKWAMESMGTFLFESRLGNFRPNPPREAKIFIENLQGLFRLMQKAAQIRENPTKAGERTPFIEYMMHQESLTEHEALSTCVDLLVGATETTTNGSLWALYCLAKNPEAQEKLYKEIKQVLPNNEAITPEKISKLHYVKAVIKETFRFYPLTFTTSRYLGEDLEIGGYNLPAGTHVQANLYAMFRNSQYYSEPEVFRPERWLRETGMNSNLKATSNLVWGHGARMCIGRRFAEQEMYIILTKIVQNYKVEYNHGNVEPVLYTVLNPERPLMFTFTPRK